ncbi:MAG: hypothetical protein AAF138_11635, partial [Planctomycetota bacterium]
MNSGPETRSHGPRERAPRMRIGEALLASGAVTQEQLEAALEEHRTTGRRVGEVLAESGMVSPAAL